jgi:putative membrane protein
MTRPDNPGHEDQGIHEAPFVLRASDLPEGATESPAHAPPPPDEITTGPVAMQTVTRLAGRRRSSFGSWFWSVLTTFLGLVISITAYDYVTGLMARFPALGIAALVLLAALAGMILVQIARELWAIRKLARIDALRRDAASALASADEKAARAVSEHLEGFYAGRSDVAWGAQNLARHRDDLLDADAIMALTERSLFGALDLEARREVEAAARTVAGVTALVPLAFADVLSALSMNIRMIRRIAEIYGAHAGLFGSWRLLRSVAMHLIATGAVAVGDDLISSVAGGSALTRISRRFGEGVVNGALTARVGIAAMEVCRPLPFSALARPSVRGVVRRSVTGLFPETRK